MPLVQRGADRTSRNGKSCALTSWKFCGTLFLLVEQRSPSFTEREAFQTFRLLHQPGGLFFTRKWYKPLGWGACSDRGSGT